MLLTYLGTPSATVTYSIDNADKTEHTAATGTGVTALHVGTTSTLYGVVVADNLGGKVVNWYEGGEYMVSETITAATEERLAELDAANLPADIGKLYDGTGELSLKSVAVTNSAGSAVTLTSSGNNGHGLRVVGNGSGEGLSAVGGATGHGIQSLGGVTSGSGISANAQASGHGFYAGAVGANKHGIVGNADSSGGSGMYVYGPDAGLKAVGGTVDIDGDLNGTVTLTAGERGSVADAVWDEAASGHATAGTFGLYVQRLYRWFFGKRVHTSSSITVYADNGTTVDASMTTSGNSAQVTKNAVS